MPKNAKPLRLTIELDCGTIIVEPAYNRAVFVSAYSLESQTMTIDHLVGILEDIAKERYIEENN